MTEFTNKQEGFIGRMPQYKSHKVVRALRIKEVAPGTGRGVPGMTLHFEEEGFKPLPKGEEWLYKHDPHEGGYYVVYEDGYESFSPAEAFEKGYTKV